jgi:hypothetical protein
VLSHLYRIAAEFEHRHGVMPNLLYLNHAHFEQLEQALSGLRDSAALLRNLDMAVVLQQDVVVQCRDKVEPGTAARLSTMG